MIKRRIFRTILITVAVVLTALIGMFATDAYCAGHLMKPVFARPASGGTYNGLGYTVEVKFEENGKEISQATMYVGDSVVSASIS